MFTISCIRQLSLICLLLAASGPVTAQDTPQASAPSGPIVAKIDLKLTLGDKVIDTIQKGDLLTVLDVRETSFVIQTFNGHKGAIGKANVATLAEAVPIYDQLIKDREDDGRLYTLRASAHWAANAADKAVADFDQAIELGYQEAHAFASRGLFHAASGNYELAIADYTQAIERDAQDDVPLMNRASVFMATGNYEKAIEDYTAAIALQPKNPVLYAQRAVAKKLVGQLAEAISDYDQTIELAANDVSAIMGRGFLNFQLGEHEPAIADFTRVIELAPDSAVAFNNRGYNYQQLKKYDLARADYQRAIELAPRYLLALQNKAWLLTTCEVVEQRDPVVAIETAKTVCELTEYKEVADLVLLAAAHAAADEFDAAIGWQEKALELAPKELHENFKQILQSYQDKKQLDLKWLEVPEAPEPTETSEPTETTETTGAP